MSIKQIAPVVVPLPPLNHRRNHHPRYAIVLYRLHDDDAIDERWPDMPPGEWGVVSTGRKPNVNGPRRRSRKRLR